MGCLLQSKQQRWHAFKNFAGVVRRTISLQAAIRMGTQIVDAASWLQRRGIAHCDIKADNVLVASITPPVAWLADFGLAVECAASGTIPGLTAPRRVSLKTVHGHPFDLADPIPAAKPAACMHACGQSLAGTCTQHMCSCQLQRISSCSFVLEGASCAASLMTPILSGMRSRMLVPR